MKKALMKALSVLLVVATIASSMPMSVFAENIQDNESNSSEALIDDNQFEDDVSGNDEWFDSGDSSNQQNDYAITGLENLGYGYNVSFTTKKACTIMVAAYVENTSEMITAASVKVSANEKKVFVEFDEQLPASYSVKAFMLDSNYAPLCKPYYCNDVSYNCDENGHIIETIPAVPPTCVEPGYTEGKFCLVCDEVLVYQEKVEALGHNVEVIPEIAPTCTEPGYTYGERCSACNEVFVSATEIAPLGHDVYEVSENQVAPTCDMNGSYDVVEYCYNCGQEISRETIVIDAIGHDVYEVSENQVAPTCDMNGSYDIVEYCYNCGQEISRETIVIAAIGHDVYEVSENHVDPTCDMNGSYDVVEYCHNCGQEISRETEVIDAIGHDYSCYVEVVDPTCSYEGHITYYCICGDSYTELLPPTGHYYDSNYYPPTCTFEGYTEYVCLTCGDAYRADYVDALGHNIVYENAVAPTCTSEGLTEGEYCSTCGEVFSAQTVVPPVGHIASDGIVENETAPTCSFNGSYDIVRYCNVCDQELSRETITIPATGEHEFIYVIQRVDPTCVEDGYQVYACGCSYDVTTTVAIPAVGHTYISFVTEPGCVDAGYTTYQCTGCSDRYIADYVDALGHTPDEQYIDNEVAPTCTSAGSYDLVTDCAVCWDEISRETIFVDAVPHSIVNGVCEWCGLSETPISGTCGENVTWTFDDSTCTLTISGTGEMDDDFSYNRPWESFEDSIKEVVIENGVTTIGDYAFYSCENLVSVTIPDSVTTIGDDAFYYCDSLTNITIPDSVTTIGNEAFCYCVNLTNIIIPDSVTSIGDEAFAYCHSLKSVIIPDSVTTIGDGAFHYCDSLTNVTIGDSVTTIGNSVFSSCDSLTSITIPDSVTTIGDYAFCECTNLTSATIGDGVTTIGYGAFYSCDSLTNVTIPDSVTIIGNSAFSLCDSLTSITIPDSVTTIGEYAFFACDSLTNVTIPDSVTTIGSSAFSGCTSLKSITIPNSVITIGESAFFECSRLTSIIIPDSVITIGDDAFCNCKRLTSVIIPDSVTTIGDDAFYNCERLTSVTIGDSVTIIGDDAFYNCDSLTDVYYSGTEEQWNEISIGYNNDPLLNATIHFTPAECSHVSTTITVPATCTANGMQYNVCVNCGETLGDVTVIPAVGHTYFSYVTEPGCVDEGYTTFQCSTCADQYRGNYVSPVGHTFEEEYRANEVAPTCTTAGSYDLIGYCGVCWDEVILETVTTTPALGHNFVDGVCSRCGTSDLFDDGEANDDFIWASLSYSSVAAASDSGACWVAKASNAVKNNEYFIIVLKESANISDFSDSDILYVDQKTAEKDGEISFSYIPKAESSNAYIIGYFSDTNTVKQEKVTPVLLEDYVCSHENTETVTGYDALCETTGLTDGTKCLDCGEMIVLQEEIPARGHNFIQFGEDISPTCILDGQSSGLVCSVCGSVVKEIEVIPAVGHRMVDGVCELCKNTDFPTGTCGDNLTWVLDTTTGILTISGTGEMYDFNSYPEWFDYNSRIESVVIADGVTSIGRYAFCRCDFTSITIGKNVLEIRERAFYNCNSLTDVYYSGTEDKWNEISIGNYNDPLLNATKHFEDGEHVHDYTSEVIAPTCTEDGYTLYTCTICGDSYISDYTGAIGHSFVENMIDPSCSTDGYTEYVCSYCNYSYKDNYIDAWGHEYSSRVYAPTCTVDGYTRYYCVYCSDSYTTDTVPAFGHDFSDWTVVKEATLLNEGLKTRTCKTCNFTDRKILDKIQVDVDTNENYGIVNFTVVHAQTLAPIKNANIFISTEKDGENTFSTDADGKVSIILPVGEHIVSAYYSGYLTRNVNITVNAGVNDIPAIGLSEKPIYEASLTSKEMTLEEIKEAGIDTSNPNNQNLYKYELNLGFGAEIDMESIIYYMNPETKEIVTPTPNPDPDPEPAKPKLHYHVVSGNSHSWCKYETVEIGETVSLSYRPTRSSKDYVFEGWYSDASFTNKITSVQIKGNNTTVYGRWKYVGDGPEPTPIDFNGGHRFETENGPVTVYPVDEHFCIIIHGEITWLKEMFDVELLVLNNSNTDTLEDLTGTLNLPEGLSLADMVNGQQSLTQSIPDVSGGESKSVHWYVRGDEAGTYDLDARLQGKIMPFNQTIDDRVLLENELTVYSGNAMHLHFEMPDAAFYAEDYPIRITLENVSDKVLYNVNHAIQVEQGMKVFYSDGSTKERTEISDWFSKGVEKFYPGDKLIFEVSVNVFFQSEVIKHKLQQLIGIVDNIEMLCNAIKIVNVVGDVISILSGGIGAVTTVLENVADYVIDANDSADSVRELKTELYELNALCNSNGNSAIEVANKFQNSTAYCDIKEITNNPEQWFANHNEADVKALTNKIRTIKKDAFNVDSKPMRKFDIFDSIRTAISAIPVRFVLESVVMTVSEESNVQIPWSYSTYPAGPRYFGVSSVSKYCSSIFTSLLGELYEETVPSYWRLIGGIDDPVNKKDAIAYIQATENEIARIKAKDATGEVTFKAWIESGNPDGFDITTDNESAEYKDGTLEFTGDGTISVTPTGDEDGVIHIVDSDGNEYTYVIEVVEEHECKAGNMEIILAPTAEADGFAVKRCVTCKEVMEIIPLAFDDCCKVHSFTDWIVEAEATDTECGINYRYCTVCGATEYEYTDPLVHEHNYKFDVLVAPTCEASGLYEYTCTICNDTYVEEVAPIGHYYLSAVVVPTCTSHGYTIYTCEYCGSEYTADYVTPIEHNYESVTTNPTCTEDGCITYTCIMCLDSYFVYIPATGHTEGDVVVENSTASSCGYPGSYDNVVYCTVCHDELSRETVTIDKLPHSYDNGVEMIAPDCLNTGIMQYTCTVCGDFYVEDIPATGHDHTATVTNPTCTEKGYTTYTCSCGNTYKDNYVAALGHTEGAVIVENSTGATCGNPGRYDNVVYCVICKDELSRETVTLEQLPHTYNGGVEVIAPTCVNTGIMEYTCLVCGDTYVEDIPAKGHDYTVVVTEATCLKPGYTTYTCACGNNYIGDEVSPLGHNYTAVVTYPTCTEDGYTTYTCERCGDKYTSDVTSATGHTEGNVIVEHITDATCGNAGRYDNVVYCTVCNEELSRETVTTEKLPHSYDKGVEVIAPTCLNTGIMQYTCTVCGDSYVEDIPATGHNYTEVVTSPTCIDKGYTTYTCTCGNKYTDNVVEALGHTEGDVVVEKSTAATCGKEGSYDNVVYCTACNEELSRETVTIEKLPHSYDNGVEVIAPTCVNTGILEYTCTACGDTYVEDIPAKGHDYTSVVTAPTCEEEGYTTYTCACGNSYVGDEVPAIGHKFVDNCCKICGKVISTETPVIEVTQNSLAILGKQVKVAISLKNNPGITSMRLKVNYDTSKLELVAVNDCGKLGSAVHSNVYESPFTLNWVNDTATENFTYNGEVVVLTFNVLENAELGETPVTVTYDFEDADIIDKNMYPVNFEVLDCNVEIIDVIIGDVNEDSKINQLDRVMLTRYIAKWDGYTEENVNLVAADVNCDGKVNQLDRVILTRYIAKWEGYETLPYEN